MAANFRLKVTIDLFLKGVSIPLAAKSQINIRRVSLHSIEFYPF